MGDLSGARGGETIGTSAGVGGTTNIGVCGVGGMEVQVEGAAGSGAAVAMGSGIQSKLERSGEGNLGGGGGYKGWVGGLGVDVTLSREGAGTATASTALPVRCLQGTRTRHLAIRFPKTTRALPIY